MKRPFTWRKFFASKLFFVAGLALLILVSVNLTRAQLKDRMIRSEIAKLQKEVDALEQEQQGYAALMALLDKPEFLEKEARSSLGYVKPGEQVVVIEQGKDKAGEDGEEGGLRKMSNPRKWWLYFFGEI